MCNEYKGCAGKSGHNTQHNGHSSEVSAHAIIDAQSPMETRCMCVDFHVFAIWCVWRVCVSCVQRSLAATVWLILDDGDGEERSS
jgi:hypothetical protein